SKGKPHQEVCSICRALNTEISTLNSKLDCVRVYAKKLDEQNRPDAYSLRMQIFDLEEEKALRNSQRDILQELAGIPASDCEKKYTKCKAKKSEVARKPSPTSRRSPRGVAPADTSDTTLLILSAIQAKAPPGYLPPTDTIWESSRNPALVDQAEDQIGRLEDLLYKKPEYQSPWVCYGLRKDVPRDACCVGCFREGHSEWCAWVMPEQYPILQNFTQLIWTLAATAPQDIPPFARHSARR